MRKAKRSRKPSKAGAQIKQDEHPQATRANPNRRAALVRGVRAARSQHGSSKVLAGTEPGSRQQADAGGLPLPAFRLARGKDLRREELFHGHAQPVDDLFQIGDRDVPFPGLDFGEVRRAMSIRFAKSSWLMPDSSRNSLMRSPTFVRMSMLPAMGTPFSLATDFPHGSQHADIS